MCQQICPVNKVRLKKQNKNGTSSMQSIATKKSAKNKYAF